MTSMMMRPAPPSWLPGRTRVRHVDNGSELAGVHGTYLRNAYPLPGIDPTHDLGVIVRFDRRPNLADVDPRNLIVTCRKDPFAAIASRLPTQYAPGATGRAYDYAPFEDPDAAPIWYPVIYTPAGIQDEGPVWLVEPYPAERADGADGLDPIDSAGVAVVCGDAEPQPRVDGEYDGDWIIPEKTLDRQTAYDANVTNQRDLLAAWVEAYAIACALNAGIVDRAGIGPEDIDVLLAAERGDLVEKCGKGASWRQIGVPAGEDPVTVPADRLEWLRGTVELIAAVRAGSAQTRYGLTGQGTALLEQIRRAGFEHDGPRCHVCGCTTDRACDGGCYWRTRLPAEPPLCSACPTRPRRYPPALRPADRLWPGATSSPPPFPPAHGGPERMDDDPITLTRIRNEIRRHQFRHANEIELHGGLATILAGLGLSVEREVQLDRRSRIEIVTDLTGGLRLGIEVKVAGRGPDVLRQVRRYAAIEQLGALMLVTTIARHMTAIMPWTTEPDGPPRMSRWMLDGKPFDVVVIHRGLL
jgi:hypothetical protein